MAKCLFFFDNKNLQNDVILRARTIIIFAFFPNVQTRFIDAHKQKVAKILQNDQKNRAVSFGANNDFIQIQKKMSLKRIIQK